MGTFMVETYLSRDAVGEPDATIARAMSVAASMTSEGGQIRYLRAIFIPDDETCLILFEATSAELVQLTARRAGMDPDRVMPADLVGHGDRKGCMKAGRRLATPARAEPDRG